MHTISPFLVLDATLFAARCCVCVCERWEQGLFKKNCPHGLHPLKCLCYCDSSQALLCRLDHYV